MPLEKRSFGRERRAGSMEAASAAALVPAGRQGVAHALLSEDTAGVSGRAPEPHPSDDSELFDPADDVLQQAIHRLATDAPHKVNPVSPGCAYRVLRGPPQPPILACQVAWQGRCVSIRRSSEIRAHDARSVAFRLGLQVLRSKLRPLRRPLTPRETHQPHDDHLRPHHRRRKQSVLTSSSATAAATQTRKPGSITLSKRSAMTTRYAIPFFPVSAAAVFFSLLSSMVVFLTRSMGCALAPSGGKGGFHLLGRLP